MPKPNNKEERETVEAAAGESFSEFRQRMIADAIVGGWGIVEFVLEYGADRPKKTLAPDQNDDAAGVVGITCERRRRQEANAEVEKSIQREKAAAAVRASDPNVAGSLPDAGEPAPQLAV